VLTRDKARRIAANIKCIYWRCRAAINFASRDRLAKRVEATVVMRPFHRTYGLSGVPLRRLSKRCADDCSLIGYDRPDPGK
jgi:hypothetical protein